VIERERESDERGRRRKMRFYSIIHISLVYETFHRMHLSSSRVGSASSLLTPLLSLFTLSLPLSSLSLSFHWLGSFSPISLPPSNFLPLSISPPFPSFSPSVSLSLPLLSLSPLSPSLPIFLSPSSLFSFG
jgi:hypothetical protein